MHTLLYAQVLQADGKTWRNVMIQRAFGAPVPLQHDLDDPRLLPSLALFPQDSILKSLHELGLPLDAPLSVVAVEMLPENANQIEYVPVMPDPLGVGLGQVRILRTSVLTPVPAICPPKAVL